MPDEYDDAPQEDSSVIKELREKAAKTSDAEARAAAAEQRAAALERQVAFKDAGLDPKNKLHQMAMNSYDGELDESAIAQYVTDLGLNAAAAPPPAVPQAEQEAFQQIGQQQAGGTTPPPPPSQAQEMEAFFNSLPKDSDKGAALSQWLEQRGEPVSWAGPQSEAMPWDQVTR